MKLVHNIFIFTMLLCVAVHGVSFSQICIGAAHGDSKIDWTDNCHAPAKDVHHVNDVHIKDVYDSPERSLNHEEGNCIDIFITSAAATICSETCDPIDLQCFKKPVTIKSDTFDHLFSFANFSPSSPTLFAAFTDITLLSIASTILII